jgi:hypothetical protein
MTPFVPGATAPAGTARNARPALVAAIVAFIAHLAPGQTGPATLHEGFVDVPGAKIYYQDSGGRGSPVVFLHAFTGSTEVFQHFFVSSVLYQLVHQCRDVLPIKKNFSGNNS